MENVGNGWVMLLADGNLIMGPSSGTNQNQDFWSNVAAFIGGGTVKAPGTTWFAFNPGRSAVTGMEPSAKADDPSDLTGLSALWVGFHDNSFGGIVYENDLGTITDAHLRTWVRDDGGLLILSAEYDGANPNVGAVRNGLNRILGEIGACSRFLGGSYDTGCGSTYCVATTNPASPLIDGTFGTANPELRYSATGYVCGGTWIAKRAGA